MWSRKARIVVLSTISLLAVWSCGSDRPDESSNSYGAVSGGCGDAGSAGDDATSVACPMLTSTSGKITDGAGNVWTLVVLSDGTLGIYLNGSYSTSTDEVVELIEVGGVIYQKNSAGGWWFWANGNWVSTSDPTAACTDGGSSSGSCHGSAPPTPSRFPDGSRRVFADAVNLPNYNLPGSPFGDQHPLVLVPSGSSPPAPDDNAYLFANSGYTGYTYIWYPQNGDPGPNLDWQFSTEFDGTPVEACIQFWSDPTATLATYVSQIRSYVAVAQKHPSACRIKVNGQTLPIVWFWGNRYQGPGGQGASFWESLQQTLASEGTPIYLLGDLDTAIDYNGGQFLPDQVFPGVASVNSLLPAFPATWTMDPAVDEAWHAMLSDVAAPPRLFAGGLLPGYSRENVTNGGYTDAEATARYRRQWEDAVASDLGWNVINTWNDVTERHESMPSTDWHWTRADITAFYSAKFRQVAPPAWLSTPQLYITTPQRINVGQPARIAEALVLNGGCGDVHVSIQLVDGNGAPWGTGVSGDAPAGQASAAVQMLAPTTLPARRFLRAHATMTDLTGKVLQQVTSAPIIVYDTNEQTNAGLSGFDYSRVHYFSISARLALPGTVGITLSGSPVAGAATATVVPPAGTTQVRFAEVLQNTYLAGNLFSNATGSVPIPLRNGQLIMNATTVNTVASGFYVARVVDDNERMGYSDPVYVAP
jgi:hypothetical protein